MFGLVKRRFFRPLLYVLVAAQVLLSAPVTAALAGSGSQQAEQKMACADSMPAADHSNPCPCCPDGTTTMAGCLSACAGAVAAIPLPVSYAAPSVPQLAPDPVYLGSANLADPPLKPPPIA